MILILEILLHLSLIVTNGTYKESQIYQMYGYNMPTIVNILSNPPLMDSIQTVYREGAESVIVIDDIEQN
jgi:hypothetical protein